MFNRNLRFGRRSEHLVESVCDLQGCGPRSRRDLDYFDRIPEQPALSILSAIEKALLGIADFPYRGAVQSELTRLAGVEIRSRLVQNYRILYIVGGAVPEIVGVIHTARDVAGVMARRLQ